MKSARFIIVFCLSLQAKVWAQKTEGNKIRFHSINQFGIIAGASDANLQLQTINGIEKATWFVGIGTGIDYYYSRSIPLFLDIRKNVFSTQKTPFIYADGGYNFAWFSTKDEKSGSGGEKQAGAYYEAGIGYLIPVFKKNGILFSAGYSCKYMSETVNVMP